MRLHLPALIAVALLAPAAALSAAQQFALNPAKVASQPFVKCHHQVVHLVNLPGRNTNFPEAVTPNCKFKTWNTLMSACLLKVGVSAPDLAYATEYGTNVCARAGVPGVEFTFPEWFLESEGGKYYLASREESGAGRSGVAAAAVIGAVILGLA